MNKIHMMRRGNAMRAVMSITAATALASVMAVQPAAAQTQASSDLRTNLTASFAEHTLLAGNATAAILGNRPAEVQAAQATLNQNSSKIAGLIGNLYGGNANSAFLPLWQRHIQYYADYANSLKAGDANGKQQAASNLMQWSVDMGMLLNSPSQFRGTAQAGTQNAGGNTANQQNQMGNLSGTQAMLTQMMQQHVMDTMKVINAQAANNWSQVYSLAAADVRHMKNVAEDLINVHSNTNAAAYQGANADLKANLAMLLVENAALNANATSAMLNNRMPEYQAAISALEANAAAMSGLLAPVYGGSTYNNVNSLWTNQSLKLSQYANALANQDVSTQEAARANVRGFTADFVKQFNQSNVQLPAATINGWGGVLTTNAIRLIDAQDANNYAQEYQLRSQTNQYLLQLPEIVGQSVSQQFPNQYGIPSAPSVPANVGSVNDNTSVASSAGTGATASTSAGADNTAGIDGTNTSTGTASVPGSDTARTTSASGDASTAGAGTVLLPTTGSDLSSSVGQVTGTTTTTGTTGTGASSSVTSTTGTTGTTTTGTSVTGTATSTTTSSSVLLPSTGADLSSSVGQVTGTATTTGTTGTGASSSVTGTTGTTGTTATTTPTTTSGSVLLPSTGADLSSSVGQVTGTATTTGTTGTTTSTTTTGAGTTTTGTTTSDSSGVLLPQSGADLSQQQQVTPNTMVPLALVIAGVALVMAVVLMSFARRDYGRQNRDE